MIKVGLEGVTLLLLLLLLILTTNWLWVVAKTPQQEDFKWTIVVGRI